jgi:hypothetical protein
MAYNTQNYWFFLYFISFGIEISREHNERFGNWICSLTHLRKERDTVSETLCSLVLEYWMLEKDQNPSNSE